MPEGYSNRLLKTAIEIVEKYHPYRFDISKAYEEYRAGHQQFLDVGKRSKSFSRHVGAKVREKYAIPDLHINVGAKGAYNIQLACMITILSFTGMRLSEALSIHKDSYSEREYGDFVVPIITAETSKANLAGVPKIDSWVTHPIAKKAIELAHEMSSSTREIYRERFKNHKQRLKQCELAFISMDVSMIKNHASLTVDYRQLKRFCDTYNIKMMPEDVEEFKLLNPDKVNDLIDGQLPTLSPHAFRRTFAVFLVRNKLGNIMTLKHQYKHLNVAMTQWYANNSDLAKALDLSVNQEIQQLIQETNVSVITDTLFDIYNSKTLSGKEGERIVSKRNETEYQGKVFITREEIERQVRKGTASVVEHPTGYCFNPTCDRICASDISTVTCQYEVVTADKAMERQAVRERLIRRFNALNDDKYYMASILSEISLKIKAIEHTLSAHNIPFEPFDEPISAKSISVVEVQA